MATSKKGANVASTLLSEHSIFALQAGRHTVAVYEDGRFVNARKNLELANVQMSVRGQNVVSLDRSFRPSPAHDTLTMKSIVTADA